MVDVRGFDVADGRPAAGQTVRLRLIHGPTVQEQTLTLDAEGRAHARFRNPVPGTNLLFAAAEVDGKTALEVNAVTVAPQALLGPRRAAQRRRPDRDRQAALRGRPAADRRGFAGRRRRRRLCSFEARGRWASDGGGRRRARRRRFTVPETVGEAAIGVAFVRDGALEYATRADRDRRARPRSRSRRGRRPPGLRAGRRRALHHRRRRRAGRARPWPCGWPTALRPAGPPSPTPPACWPAAGPRRRTRPRQRSGLARLGRADPLDRARQRGRRARRAARPNARPGRGARPVLEDRPRRAGRIRGARSAAARPLRRLGAQDRRRRRRRRRHAGARRPMTAQTSLGGGGGTTGESVSGDGARTGPRRSYSKPESRGASFSAHIPAFPGRPYSG